MSRVGKNPVALPSGVQASLSGNVLTVKGKLGSLSHAINDNVDAQVTDNAVVLKPKSDTKQARALWGTTRSIVNGLVTGVSAGFTVILEITGVGYRCAVQGKELVLQLGYSHEVRYEIPQGITIAVDKQTVVTITGADKQLVGQVAANIRSYREPEPYKGKGIKYQNEKILRKEGKKK